MKTALRLTALAIFIPTYAVLLGRLFPYKPLISLFIPYFAIVLFCALAVAFVVTNLLYLIYLATNKHKL